MSKLSVCPKCGRANGSDMYTKHYCKSRKADENKLEQIKLEIALLKLANLRGAK